MILILIHVWYLLREVMLHVSLKVEVSELFSRRQSEKWVRPRERRRGTRARRNAARCVPHMTRSEPEVRCSWWSGDSATKVRHAHTSGSENPVKPPTSPWANGPLRHLKTTRHTHRRQMPSLRNNLVPTLQPWNKVYMVLRRRSNFSRLPQIVTRKIDHWQRSTTHRVIFVESAKIS